MTCWALILNAEMQQRVNLQDPLLLKAVAEIYEIKFKSQLLIMDYVRKLETGD